MIVSFAERPFPRITGVFRWVQMDICGLLYFLLYFNGCRKLHVSSLIENGAYLMVFQYYLECSSVGNDKPFVHRLDTLPEPHLCSPFRNPVKHFQLSMLLRKVVFAKQCGTIRIVSGCSLTD